MTTTSTTTTDQPTQLDKLTVREARFVDALRAGHTELEALALAGYDCAPGASSAAMVRKLRSRPRVLAALGDQHPAALERRRARERELAVLQRVDRHMIARLVDASTGGQPLTAFEAVAALDMRDHLGIEIAKPLDGADDATPRDAPEADPAAVERGAP